MVYNVNKQIFKTNYKTSLSYYKNQQKIETFLVIFKYCMNATGCYNQPYGCIKPLQNHLKVNLENDVTFS